MFKRLKVSDIFIKAAIAIVVHGSKYCWLGPTRFFTIVMKGGLNIDSG